jgi:hypothetical protein
MIWIILLVAALAIFVFYKPPQVENMTNKDLLATLDKFGKTGTKPKTKPVDPYEEAIYGPKAPKLEEPSPVSSKGKNDDGSSVYPDIYGPEITPIPGKKQCATKGKHSSDCADDQTYEFNPDLQKAFPMEENEPQPFLTDYSKFQH